MIKTFRAGRVAAFVLLLFQAPLSVADSSRSAQVQAWLASFTTLSADFTQNVTGGPIDKISEARGRLVISRPNRFYWQYSQPYEQLIVGDGQRLWIYDRDLEQVTVKTMEEVMGHTPLALLSGHMKVSENFHVASMASDDGLVWWVLEPLVNDTGFSHISIGLTRQGDLARMSFLDTLGQQSTLTLSNVKRDPDVDESLFQFTPPSEADVLRYDL